MAASTLFITLPARPPTPPKESKATDQVEAEADLPASSRAQVPLDTPVESPVSITTLPSADRTRKRVGFILKPESIDHIPKLTPNSSEARRPRRSILKSSSNPASSDPAEPDFDIPECRDGPTMLEDCMIQLANPHPSARLDAYMALNRCLKAFSDMPTEEALAAKTEQLGQCIRRDLTDPGADDHFRRTQITQEAVRLANTLLWKDSTARSLPHGLYAWLASTAVTCIADRSPSKTLVNLYLQLLAKLDYSPRNVTTETVGQLITALHNLEERVSGKSIMAWRLLIYQRLVQQEHPLMARRAGDWIQNVFNGLLCDVPEIRDRAVHVGIAAGITYGAVESVSSHVRASFDSPTPEAPESNLLADVYARKLESWLSSEEHAARVPQAWIVPVLFLRSRLGWFKTWTRAVRWLALMSKAFNSTNVQVKVNCSREWCRLIYCLATHPQDFQSRLGLQLRPIKSQLKRLHGGSRDHRAVRAAVLSSYWTLLYYAFRPGQSEQMLDRMWRDCVQGQGCMNGKDCIKGKDCVKSQDCVEALVSSPITSSLVSFEPACRMLITLLGGGASTRWDHDRGRTPLTVDELPRLEPKWVRSRSEKVLRVVEVLVRSDAGAASPQGEELVLRVWRSFLGALRDAAAREVKVSTETMRAVASVTGALTRIVTHAYKSDLGSDRRDGLARFGEYLRAAIDTVGALPFVEPRLRQGPSGLEVVEVPSSKPSPQSAPLISPAQYLLGFLARLADSDSAEEEHGLSIKTLISISISSCTSSDAKMGMLLHLFRDCVTPESVTDDSRQRTWNIVAALATTILVNIAIETELPRAMDPPLKTVKQAIALLDFAIQYANPGTVSFWVVLLDTVKDLVVNAAGPDLMATVLIEPLADAIKKQATKGDTVVLADMTSALLERVKRPSSAKSAEKAHKAFWGTAAPRKADLLSLPTLICQATMISQRLYADANSLDRSSTILVFLDALASFIDSCSASSSHMVLNQLLPAFELWITDTEEKLTTADSVSKAILKSVVNLWSHISGRIQSTSVFNSALLSTLEGPLKAAFTSRHKTIVSRCVILWNETFGKVKDLQYPEDLRKIAFRVSFIADISLPGILVSEGDSQPPPDPLHFADTPSDLDEVEDQQALIKSATKISNLRSGLFSKGEAQSGSTGPLSEMHTEHPRRVQGSKGKTTLRPRHDDSQIVFAEIDSSPPRLSKEDSQLLTANQKEVRQRQTEEAATVFSAIRSSPRTGTIEQLPNSPEPQLPPGDNTRTQIRGAAHLRSPDLGTPQAEASSSPTPCAAKAARTVDRQESVRPSCDDSSIDDIPSSPPVPLRRKRSLPKKGGNAVSNGKAISSPLQRHHTVNNLDQTEDRVPASEPQNTKSGSGKRSRKEPTRKRKSDEISGEMVISESFTSPTRPPGQSAADMQIQNAAQEEDKEADEKSSGPAQSIVDEHNNSSDPALDFEALRQQALGKPVPEAPSQVPSEEDPVSSQIAAEMAMAAAQHAPASTAVPQEESSSRLDEQPTSSQPASSQPASSQPTSSQRASGRGASGRKRGRPAKRGRGKSEAQPTPTSSQESAAPAAVEEIEDCIVVSSVPMPADLQPVPVSPVKPWRGNRKRSSQDMAGEPGSTSPADESQPRKRARGHLGLETIVSSDPVRMVPSSPLDPDQAPDDAQVYADNGDAAGSANGARLEPSGPAQTGASPAADDGLTLVQEMEKVLERAKRGIPTAERKALMKASVVMMGLFVEE